MNDILKSHLASKHAFSIAEAVHYTGIGRTTIFALIKDGRLTARKLGSRTLILRTELERFLEGLPTGNSADR